MSLRLDLRCRFRFKCRDSYLLIGSFMKVLCANLTIRPDTVHRGRCRRNPRPRRSSAWRFAVARFPSRALPAVLGLLALAVLTATAQTQLERFCVVGNLPSSTCDEFDNGVIEPWEIFEPTIVEAGGVVTFSSPGEVQPPFVWGNLEITAEFSYLGDAVPFEVSAGNGDFTATSEWRPNLPGMNQHYGMNLGYEFADESGDEEDIAIHLYNFEPGVAELLAIPPGVGIFFGSDAALESRQGVLINKVNVTGNILLRLNFDDAANSFNAAFSLDGGTSFQTPFSPVASRMADPSPGVWSFGAESWKVIGPPELSVGLTANNEAVISWPASATGYGLEETVALANPSWSGVDATATDVGDKKQVIVPIQSGSRFYRLKRP